MTQRQPTAMANVYARRANLELEQRLEWFLYGGDGDEYELWQDPSTGKIYRVPIEIVRDWDNITEEKNTETNHT